MARVNSTLPYVYIMLDKKIAYMSAHLMPSTIYLKHPQLLTNVSFCIWVSLDILWGFRKEVQPKISLMFGRCECIFQYCILLFLAHTMLVFRDSSSVTFCALHCNFVIFVHIDSQVLLTLKWVVSESDSAITALNKGTLIIVGTTFEDDSHKTVVHLYLIAV